MSLTRAELEFIRHAAERLDVRSSTKLFCGDEETATDKKLVHELYNIADLKDQGDDHGRTYREINNATKHKIEIGELVELDTGVRLFVIAKTRDCDGAPLYCLGAIKSDESKMYYGYSEEALTLIQ